MTGTLIFVWVVFIGLAGVCSLGCFNLIKVSKMRDKERLWNCLLAMLALGVFTFGIGFFLFSPRHDAQSMRTSHNIIGVALGLNIIFQVRQYLRLKKNEHEDTPPSI